MNSKLFVLEVAMEMALPQTLLQNIADKFGADKARQCAMATSVGGIGPLIKDRVWGQSDQGIQVVSVSLLYETVWYQEWDHDDQIRLKVHPVGEALKQTLTKTDLGFTLTNFDGTSIIVDVWKTSYGSGEGYFLASPDICKVVYPGPKDAPAGTTNAHAWSHDERLKQSWLLGRGALVLAKKLNQKPDFINLSETPTIFAHQKLVKDSLQNDAFFENTRYIFNDHTPLEYAHPIWDLGTLNKVLMDPSIYHKSPGWNADKKTLDITSLLVGNCDGVFGVAKKHGTVMREMPSLKQFEKKIKTITNGVRKQEWQAKEYDNYPDLTDDQLLEIKDKLKRETLTWLAERSKKDASWLDRALHRRLVVLTRRITPYKRLDVLVKLLNSSQFQKDFIHLDIVLVVGGRIHQQDNHAQDIVFQFLETLNKNPELSDRIIFLDNFNVWEAPKVYFGSEGTIMMADDTREASATGFMKAQMNGAAVIATSDGAVPEFVRFDNQNPSSDLVPTLNYNGKSENGFFIPYEKGEPTPQGLYKALKSFLDSLKDNKKRAQIIKTALLVTTEVDIARTAKEMRDFYEILLQTPPLFSPTKK